MKRTVILLMVTGLVAAASNVALADDDSKHHRDSIFRRANFSNEFGLQTPEGINARGDSTVRSLRGLGLHDVRILATGLTPGRLFVIVNHFFEPVAGRGVGPSTAADDPSCTGHFQFIGSPVRANHRGEIRIAAVVDQLAPHVWVVDLNKFIETTGGGTHAPSSPDSFVTGGLLIPYGDLLGNEVDFVDTDPLTDCGG